VSWTIHPSESARHLVLRASAGEALPDALVTRLRDEHVACGWLRASGVLTDVELRAFDPGLGTLGTTRRVSGPVHVLALDGSIGRVDGEPSVSLRALLARETDRGLETLAGEIHYARTVALEVLVTALDDLSLERALDAAAGVWLLGAGAQTAAARAPAPAPSAGAWSAAVEASERVEREPARPPRAIPAAAGSSPSAAAPQGAARSWDPAGAAPMPARPPRPGVDLDAPFPEPGDAVEHFAFGPCDVLKSDGDRLHLKVHKDGRIREIALEMLRVSRMPDVQHGKRRFKLERRL
jgi:predicted DNA-binding protein with PD1-like motif